jgi:DNA-directed RNA polymerase specialized sigma24 family protein
MNPPMLREDIISMMYSDKDINAAIGKMQPIDLQEDLKQEIFFVICELPPVRLVDMYSNGYLKYFIVRTMLNMAKSDRSTFYNTFRRSWNEYGDHHDKAEEIYSEEMSDRLYESMEILHWYEQEVFKLYSQNGKNILALSKETKIPYRSLFKTIRKVKALLKAKIRNHKELC